VRPVRASEPQEIARQGQATAVVIAEMVPVMAQGRQAQQQAQ
jgi:hypothetical protein